MSRDRRDHKDVEPAHSDADILVKVPDIGDQYYPDLIITGWLASNGERIDTDVPLLTISTEKADFDVSSPACGVLEIIANLNALVRVGQTVAIIHPDQ